MFSQIFLVALVVCFHAISNADDPPMPGGKSRMDLTNADNKQRAESLTDFAVTKLNQKSNDLFHNRRVKLLSAESQVVQGFKYFFTFYMGQTTCAKNDVQHDQVNSERCPISNEPTAKFNKCIVTIWEKSWENFKEVTSDTCETVERSEAMS